MKKIFYLMSVACLMMVASCDKNNGEGSETKEPSVTNLEGVQTAGSSITVKAENLAADAKFSLKPATGDAISLEATIMSSGAEITLPYNLGTFTLCLEQDDKEYTIGEIEIAVTGVTVPKNIVPFGSEVTITGNGFAPNAVIVLDETEVVTTSTVAGVKFVVPEGAAESTIQVRQEGTTQDLEGVLKAMKKKNRKNIAADIFGGLVHLELDATYDTGEPKTFAWTLEMYEETMTFTYSISHSGDSYSFNGEYGLSWEFTVENSLVTSLKYNEEEYPWQYNSDNQLAKFSTQEGEPYVINYDENGNCEDFASAYADPQLTISNPFEIDFGIALGELMNIEANPEIFYAAMMFGWIGNPSKLYPSSNADLGEEVPFEYVKDGDGYVTNADAEGAASISCTFE